MGVSLDLSACWVVESIASIVVVVSLRSGTTSKSGAVGVKEILVETKALCLHRCNAKNPITQTTLGNGYLGSCIDEERSEMRYLV